MSGIVGLFSRDGAFANSALLQDLTASLAFRGPDGQAIWVEGQAGLGHTRFLAASRSKDDRQPCMLDERLWITADIRLDYREELIGRLRERGRHRLDDPSDAELVLYAYDTWGDDCLQYLLGDFAFVLWDKPRRRLFGAVDHFRIKSLYYSQAPNGFVVSNTLECVRRHPAVSDRLNETALGDFLLFECYQDQSVTIYADVQRLPPAHYMTWEKGQVRVARYWSLPVENPDPASACDRLDQFDELLTQAVKDRLHGTGIGIFMSGGLDSPMLAAKAQSLLAASGSAEPLQAFTVVFDHLIPDQERYYSGLVTKALGIRQHIETGDEFELFAGVAGRDWRSPEPINFPRWEWYVRHLHRVAAISPVVFTGTDGEAPLSTSLPYHWARLLQSGRLGRFLRDSAWYMATQRRLPGVGVRSSLRRLFKAEPHKPVPPPLPAWLNPEFSKRVGLSDRWAAMSVSNSPVTPRGRAFRSLAAPHFGTIFDLFDAGWTGCPVELRHPLMDVRLLSFLLRLPAIPWCINKELFRRWLRPRLPPEVCRRPKTYLLEEPVRVKLQKQAVPLEKSVAFQTESCYYVNPRAIGSLRWDLHHSGYNVWLRPFSLDYWLKRRTEEESQYEPKRPEPDQRFQAASDEML